MDLQQDSFEVTTTDIEDSKIDESLVGCFPMFFFPCSISHKQRRSVITEITVPAMVNVKIISVHIHLYSNLSWWICLPQRQYIYCFCCRVYNFRVSDSSQVKNFFRLQS